MKKLFRDNILDALRGFALILMLLAHAENLFNNGKNTILGTANSIGITFSLTLFIFASGVGSGYLYFADRKGKEKKETHIVFKTLKRFLSIYFVYATLNIIYLSLISPLGWSKDLIFDALLFKTPQIYTEFLIPLMVLPFIGLLISKLPKVIYKNIIIYGALISFVYLIGAFGATISWSENIRPYMILLFGSFNDYRYPIFQYAVIYLVGLRLGIYLLKGPSDKIKQRDIGQSVLISLLILVSFVFTNTLPPSEFDFFRRWPPGIGFMLIGIVLAFVFYFINVLQPKRSIWYGLAWLGRITLVVFWLHIVLIYIYKHYFNYGLSVVSLTVIAMLAFILLNISLGFLHTKIFSKLGTKIDLSEFFLTFLITLLSFGIIAGSVYAEANRIPLASDNTIINDFVIDIDKEPKLTIQSSRLWLIKSTQVSEDMTKAEIKILIDQKLRAGRNVVLVLEHNGNRTIINTEKTNDLTFKAYINQADLETGIYKLYAHMKDRPSNISNDLMINVSYPLIVTWTLDYEGYDISNNNLNAIASFSDTYGMPLTHLFNPRIFVASEISTTRSDYLVSWVLNRKQNNNDEIGLHLHMHCDMVTAAGLKYKTTPRWGWRTNCHDVLTSAYNYDEFTQIIKWSKAQFAQHNLPEPITYRAGGWFISEPQLKVLQDQGFLIDTSGRTSYVWGTQTGPWTLTETTFPYYISESEQNSSIPEPTLSLVELPNNGWDSTNNDARILLDVFDKNYQNQPLNKLQVLTYMSHPHWFVTYDQKRVIEVLEYVGKNKAIDDNGPIIYLTSEQAYYYWNKQ